MLKKSQARLIHICCLCQEKGTDHKQVSEELIQCCYQESKLIEKYVEKHDITVDLPSLFISQFIRKIRIKANIPLQCVSSLSTPMMKPLPEKIYLFESLLIHGSKIYY